MCDDMIHAQGSAAGGRRRDRLPAAYLSISFSVPTTMNMSMASFSTSSGENPPSADRCDMQHLIESFSRSYEQQLALRGMMLCTRVRGPIPRFVHADAESLGLLFDSLSRCSSAVEARGCAVFDIAAEQEKGDRYNIYFALTLSGKGLDVRQEQQLQAGRVCGKGCESASALLQAKAICRRYGGNILVKNSIGYGTRFLVKICLADTTDGETVDHG